MTIAFVGSACSSPVTEAGGQLSDAAPVASATPQAVETEASPDGAGDMVGKIEPELLDASPSIFEAVLPGQRELALSPAWVPWRLGTEARLPLRCASPQPGNWLVKAEARAYVPFEGSQFADQVALAYEFTTRDKAADYFDDVADQLVNCRVGEGNVRRAANVVDHGGVQVATLRRLADLRVPVGERYEFGSAALLADRYVVIVNDDINAHTLDSVAAFDGLVGAIRERLLAVVEDRPFAPRELADPEDPRTEIVELLVAMYPEPGWPEAELAATAIREPWPSCADEIATPIEHPQLIASGMRQDAVDAIQELNDLSMSLFKVAGANPTQLRDAYVEWFACTNAPDWEGETTTRVLSSGPAIDVVWRVEPNEAARANWVFVASHGDLVLAIAMTELLLYEERADVWSLVDHALEILVASGED